MRDRLIGGSDGRGHFQTHSTTAVHCVIRCGREGQTVCSLIPRIIRSVAQTLIHHIFGSKCFAAYKICESSWKGAIKNCGSVNERTAPRQRDAPSPGSSSSSSRGPSGPTEPVCLTAAMLCHRRSTKTLAFTTPASILHPPPTSEDEGCRWSLQKTRKKT